MCIAILRPAKTRVITDEELENSKRNNSDGFGYSFVAHDPKKKEDYVIVRTFMDFEKFKSKLREDEKVHIHTPFMIHFRATSAGSSNLANCHPFSVSRYQSMCHNGTLFTVGIKETRSDTNIFNEEVLSVLPPDWLENEGIKFLVESFVSPGKIIILNSDMSYFIFGEKSGHYFDGIWWSNNDYKVFRRNQPIYNYNNIYGGINLPAKTDKKIIRTTTFWEGERKYKRVAYDDGTVSTKLVTEPKLATEQEFFGGVGLGSWEDRMDNLWGTGDTNSFRSGSSIEKDNKDTKKKDFKKDNKDFNCAFCGLGFTESVRNVAVFGGYENELCPTCYEEYKELNGVGAIG